MKIKPDLDILVLGAGPAGIAIACLMADKGYSVEIVDPAFFPRPKICGEFLNPQAVTWLDKQGLLPSLLELQPYPIYGMRITDREGTFFEGRYGADQPQSGFAVMRKDFDTLLVREAKKAKITILEGWRAQKILFDGEMVAGITGVDTAGQIFEKRSRILVGADGRNNLIGRTFGWMSGIPNLRKHVFHTYFENLPGTSNFGEIHLVPDGYLGIAPLTQSLANIALVIDEKAAPDLQSDPMEFLLERLRYGDLEQRFSQARPIASVNRLGPLAFEVKQTSGYGTILVGDACGFIDPFTGEGINYAFVSAELASEVLDASFRKSNFSNEFLRAYDVARQKALGKKFRLSKLLQKAISTPHFSSFLVRRFASNLKLGNMMVSAVGSAIPMEKIWNLGFALRVALGR